MRHNPSELFILAAIFFVIYGICEILFPTNTISIWGNLGFILLGVILCIVRIRLLRKNRSTSSSKLPLIICIPLLVAADTTCAQESLSHTHNIIPVHTANSFPYVVRDSVVASIQSPDWIGDTLCMIQVRFEATNKRIKVMASFATRALKEKLLRISTWDTFPQQVFARLVSTRYDTHTKLDRRNDSEVHYEIFAITL